MNNLDNPLIDISPVELIISSELAKMKLSELRSSRHMTKKEVAELTGLSEKCIASIEKGTGNPTFKSIQKYITCLGYEMSFKEKND